VEVDVGQATHGDRQGGILAAVGGGDHRVRHADELLLDRAGLLRLCLCHAYLFLLPRAGAFALRLIFLVGRDGRALLLALPFALSFSLGSLPPFSRAQASTTSSM